MSNYGIKISKVGFDIKTAGIANQMFNSEKNCLKIASTGTASSTASGSRTITVAHGLGLTPGFICLAELADDGKNYFCPVDVVGWTVTPYSDGTNFKVDIYTSISQKVDITYLLFIDPGD